MKIEIDTNAGFCFGVTRVVEMAENIIRKQGNLYCLGEIVHNRKEIQRLESIGLKTISYEEFFRLSDCTVLIRAHGEPPETYQHAAAHNITLIDGTCPIVLRLQKRIRNTYHEHAPGGIQVVIYGKKDHAEVRGLSGQVQYNTIILESEADLDLIDYSKPIHIFSQTTMNLDKYNALRQMVVDRARQAGAARETVTCTSSVCGQVSNRVPKLRHFCSLYDVILFVSSVQSSNGKLLFAHCREANKNTYFVSETTDVKPAWFVHASSVGITGATSTPRWLLEQFAREVLRLSDDANNSY
jgi:4-hydroxy-3-methylbut-2-enyl diphosphate reductase